MKTTKQLRIDYALSNRLLKKARRRYILLHRNRLQTGTDLRSLQRRMQERGLYSEKTFAKDVQWSILRYLWHATKREGMSFEEWKLATGWRQNQWCQNGLGWRRHTVQLPLDLEQSA